MLRSVLRSVRRGGLSGARGVGRGVYRASWSAAMELLEGRRLLAAGDLDTTFNGTGIAMPDFAVDGREIVHALAFQNGKILVAGGVGDDFFLGRFNADGTVDNSFGTDGYVRTDLGGNNDAAYAVALLSNGSILVGGKGGVDPAQAALVRYSSEGALDAAFGTNGVLLLGAQTQMIDVSGIVLQGEKILIRSAWPCKISRLNADGSLDSSFGSNGTTETPVVGSPYSSMLRLDGEGRILAGGIVVAEQDMAAARLDANGALDSTFGDGGVATVQFATQMWSRADALTIQDDGKIVLAGVTDTGGSNYAFGLARLTELGEIDTSFGSGGTVTTTFAFDTEIIDYEAHGVAIQPDGKIVAFGSGYTETGSRGRFLLARYGADGSLDASFGSGGLVATVPTETSNYGEAMGIQSDGKIVGTGFSSVRMLLARYDAGDITPPTASFQGPAVTRAGGKSYTFGVVFTDETAIDVGTIQSATLMASTSGWNGAVTLVGTQASVDGKSCTATYRLTPPGGSWDNTDNGTYAIAVGTGAVADEAGHTLDSNTLGSFAVNVPFAYLSRGWLVVSGTAKNDAIKLTYRKGYITTALGKQRLYFESKQVSKIMISALAGHDVVFVGSWIIGATIDGGEGNDNLTGGNGNDTLKGIAGNDTIRGGNGNDMIDGGTGCDMLYGDAGNDTLYAREKAVDTLDGGAGTDSAKCDMTDTRKDIEKLLK